ncbi:hypothetical protein SEA_KNOCKER_67 [Mycobacterium phage Knocker]|nr:hypothetical protein SEA_KNOCKER_67 [Mycobacterium phage Knocker]
MNEPLHPPRPEVSTWPGLPVTCSACLRAGCPVMTEDGWRLPVHVADERTGRNCPGSLSGVP